jgi:hypothetical protein
MLRDDLRDHEREEDGEPEAGDFEKTDLEREGMVDEWHE